MYSLANDEANDNFVLSRAKRAVGCSVFIRVEASIDNPLLFIVKDDMGILLLTRGNEVSVESLLIRGKDTGSESFSYHRIK
jgi:hypothetical protein